MARQSDISLNWYGATARLSDVELRATRKMDLTTFLLHVIMPLGISWDGPYIQRPINQDRVARLELTQNLHHYVPIKRISIRITFIKHNSKFI